MRPHLPECERCGANSYDGSDDNPICPWCKKRKYRGSKEELAEHIRKLREVCFAAVGFLAGQSIRTPESMRQWLVDVLKETE